MRLLFIWPNKDSFGFKPINIALLSALAKREGWDTRLFDTTEIDFGHNQIWDAGESAKIFKPVDLSPYDVEKKPLFLEEELLRELKEFSPDCIAISALSDEIQVAGKVTRVCKEAIPDVPVIWGGKYATTNPESTLLEYGADYACVGEGLEAFPEFLHALQTGEKGDIRQIANLCFKDGMVVNKNKVRPLLKDLDTLPYVDWEIFDKRHSYKPFDGDVYVSGDHMLNWGCPYHCTYCINAFYHDLYDNRYVMRRYSNQRIVDELLYLKERYKLEFFKFHDEDFLMRSLKDFEELSNEYRDRVNLPFTIESNPKLVTQKKARLLKNMNCASVSLAIETGNMVLRKDLLERVDSEEDIMNAFRWLREEGVRTSAFNLLGIPFETRETYMETVDVNRRANPQYPNINFFFPFENTKLRTIAIEEGNFSPDNRDQSSVYDVRPALHFKELSEDQLIQMKNVFVYYVKLPKAYEPYIRRSENMDEVGRRLRKQLSEIYDELVWRNDGWFVDDGSQEQYLNQLQKILSEEEESE